VLLLIILVISGLDARQNSGLGRVRKALKYSPSSLSGESSHLWHNAIYVPKNEVLTHASI
jgi:hypothetical protein